jgi:hypothetical protein
MIWNLVTFLQHLLVTAGAPHEPPPQPQHPSMESPKNPEESSTEPSTSMDETKEFIVTSGHRNGSVEVDSEHTLSDVRALILDDFDEHMLPPPTQEWAFWVNGLHVGSKLELEISAWDIIDEDIHLIPKKPCLSPIKEEMDEDEKSPPRTKPGCPPRKAKKAEEEQYVESVSSTGNNRTRSSTRSSRKEETGEDEKPPPRRSGRPRKAKKVTYPSIQ